MLCVREERRFAGMSEGSSYLFYRAQFILERLVGKARHLVQSINRING